jgi:hypothetical protein
LPFVALFAGRICRFINSDGANPGKPVATSHVPRSRVLREFRSIALPPHGRASARAIFFGIRTSSRATKGAEDTNDVASSGTSVALSSVMTIHRSTLVPCALAAVPVALSLAVAGTLSACSGGGGSPGEGTHQEHDGIIGGVPATSASLDAVGTLGFMEPVDAEPGQPPPAGSATATRGPALAASDAPSETYRIFCTASLLGESAVLTAHHCVKAARVLALLGKSVYFGIGGDDGHPKRLIEAVAFQVAPIEHGGRGDQGSDVAVALLAEKVTDVEPIGVAQPTPAEIGQRFAIVGFGRIDYAQTLSPMRRVGSATLRALSGNIYDFMFGGYQGFRTWAEATLGPDDAGTATVAGEADAWNDGSNDAASDAGIDDGSMADARADAASDAGIDDGGMADAQADAPIDSASAEGGGDASGGWEERLQRAYAGGMLLADYQGLVGGELADAMPCHGDSGGPLARWDGARLVAYAVASMTVPTERGHKCGASSVYATFGPTTLAFLEQARSWTDPCAGIAPGGQCDGAVAVRCTTPREGDRRVTRTDCAAVGQACGTDSDGAVACVDRSSSTAASIPLAR